MFNTYITLMFIAFLLSVYTWKKFDSKVIYIVLVLLLGLITEFIVILIKAQKIDHAVLYHIYIPAEYTLFALFFRTKTAKKKIDRVILYSVPGYIITSLILSAFFYHFKGFPSLNSNIEGFLIIIWSVWLLNSFDGFEETSIFMKPTLWLCMGLIVFYAGNFIFNSYYNHIKNTDKALAKMLNEYINNGLNIFLYLTMSISFLCTRRAGKF
jgi:hypothetical protein